MMRLFSIHASKLLIILLLLIPLLIMSCSSTEEEEDTGPIERIESRPEVIFDTIDDEPMQVYITSQGVVEASREQVISSRVSGYVEETVITDGRYASAGDTLLSFRENEFILDMKEAENGLAEARYLFNTDYASLAQQTNRTEEENLMLRINSGLEQAEITYQRAQQQFENIHVTAPFSGYLSVEEQAVPGGYLGNGTELARLLDDRTVNVRFDVLEAEVNQIRPGMEVIVTSPTGIRMTGQVSTVSPVVDPDSKTGQVRAVIANPDRILKTGMTIGGRINVITHTGGIRIPRMAVLERDGGRMLVFRLSRDENNDPYAEWVYIEPDELIGLSTEYAMVSPEKLSPSDTLAVGQHFSVSHLQPVTPRMEGTIPLEEQGGQQ